MNSKSDLLDRCLGRPASHLARFIGRLPARGGAMQLLAPRSILFTLVLLSTAFAANAASRRSSDIAPITQPASATDLTKLQCGNLIYGGNKSSVCFADRFLADVARETCLSVGRSFCPVRLDSPTLFDYPFCVFSGEESFALTQRERENFRKYLMNGGFILASPGCSDEKWDQAVRTEIKLSFPEYALNRIPMTHPIFSTVNQLPRLTDKHGKVVLLEGLEINGRLVMVYSKEGLNDVAHAKGCCCCGGNEIRDPARVNVNVFTYALLY
jgi:hypothetical protein